MDFFRNFVQCLDMIFEFFKIRSSMKNELQKFVSIPQTNVMYCLSLTNIYLRRRPCQEAGCGNLRRVGWTRRVSSSVCEHLQLFARIPYCDRPEVYRHLPLLRRPMVTCHRRPSPFSSCKCSVSCILLPPSHNIVSFFKLC